MWQPTLTCLFVQGYIHTESEHALYPVSIGLCVSQLVAWAQRGRLKQNHGQIWRSLVLSVILKDIGKRNCSALCSDWYILCSKRAHWKQLMHINRLFHHIKNDKSLIQLPIFSHIRCVVCFKIAKNYCLMWMKWRIIFSLFFSSKSNKLFYTSHNMAPLK